MQTFEVYYDGQSGAVSGGEHVRWLYISAGWHTIPGDGVGGRGGGAPLLPPMRRLRPTDGVLLRRVLRLHPLAAGDVESGAADAVVHGFRPASWRPVPLLPGTVLGDSSDSRP